MAMMERGRRRLRLLRGLDRPDEPWCRHGPRCAHAGALRHAPTRSPATTRRRRAYDPVVMLDAPPIVPSGLLNRASIRAFNEFWFRKAPRCRRDELQTITTFFHPSSTWSRTGTASTGRAASSSGSTSCPTAPRPIVHDTVERLSDRGCTSFLAVLKRFGPGNPGPLSFPMPGWTLALDVPVGVSGLGRLLDELDDDGGRRRRTRLPGQGQPDAGRAAARGCTRGSTSGGRSAGRVDPEGRLRSDLARRLRLI